MARGKPIDRQEIHETLWEARNKNGKVMIHQIKFAEFMDITSSHMSRIISELVAQGRLKKIAARKANIGIYVVRDPSEFETSKTTTGIGPAQ